jgi:16S rRNA (cytosine1402-N4)-methyltransferase
MRIHDDFKNMAHRFAGLGIGRAQGILLDLGVSSMQLDRPERGFSFRADGPLDMRMNAAQKLTAREIVNEWPRKEIEKIIFEYGEERFGRRIAERIERERSVRKIETTGQLASIVSAAVPASYRHGRIHPATRTFQALRIAVNGEIDSLREFLETAVDALEEGGRLVIISFHSLEDRMVKNAFREWQKGGKGRVLTKKPVTASETEIGANPRSRSAKLRAFERSAGTAS